MNTLKKYAFAGQLWTAPEILRMSIWCPGTQKGDVYSFAIILQEIIVRGVPYEDRDIDSIGESIIYLYGLSFNFYLYGLSFNF